LREVVDDNEDAATLLAEALTCRGHRVRVAHDAAAALRLAANQTFDIALLDIGLPVMDGYELAGKLRELRHLSRVSLVAVTGYGQGSDRRRALAAGFHHHLVKPVNLTVLNRIVDETSLRLTPRD
jgi:CheY-like chemotaxis protein